MSSESEWSCRVEGSGSQCNVLIQPNHQAVLVREKKNRTDRQEEENKGMDPNGEDGQKVSHVKKMLKMGETEAERQREEKNGERVIRETSACW